MDLQWTTIETWITVISLLLGLIALSFLLRLDWKSYGLLSLLVGLFGASLCASFVGLGFYSFPYLLFPNRLGIPIAIMSLVVSSIIALSIRYSPLKWSYKIPYYWGIVHIVVALELVMQLKTSLIKYKLAWNAWDSYSAWWLYFLIFEWLGGKIIPSALRNPIDSSAFQYGNWGWIVLHIILITTFIGTGLGLGLYLYKQ